MHCVHCGFCSSWPFIDEHWTCLIGEEEKEIKKTNKRTIKCCLIPLWVCADVLYASGALVRRPKVLFTVYSITHLHIIFFVSLPKWRASLVCILFFIFFFLLLCVFWRKRRKIWSANACTTAVRRTTTAREQKYNYGGCMTQIHRHRRVRVSVFFFLKDCAPNQRPNIS